jgi:hypothetical protein
VQLDDEAAGLDGGVAVDQRLRFLRRLDVEDEDASQLAAVSEGAGEGELTFLGEPRDVGEVVALELVELGRPVRRPRWAATDQAKDVLVHVRVPSRRH